MHPIVNIAITAARAAGEIINRSASQLDRLKISHKQNQELVSNIDIHSEGMIIETIKKAYPEHTILAEESGLQKGSDNTKWIIDPLDGTRNYLQGFPHYCVSIAVEINNKIEHAVIYDPLRQECFSASRGGGAMLNDRRIRVGKNTNLNTCLVGTGIPFRSEELTEKYLPGFKELMIASAGVRRTGSAALDLAYVAMGRLDGFWEFSLKPWDIAAGALIVKESGGLVGDFNGSEKYIKSGNIVAGNPKIFKSILQTLKPTLNN